MTAAKTSLPESSIAAHASVRSQWRPLLAFGSGVAIEITDNALELAIVKVRPSGPELLRRATIIGLHERPAAGWSSEFRAFVRGHETSGVTVLLPRREVIVRHVQMTGVPRRELAGALALRLRALHPFADDDVAWCWSPVTEGVLVGLTRMSLLARYETMMAEAGIPVAGFTFSASALYSAMRLMGQPARPFLGLSESAASVFEAYGESASGAVFSGEFKGSASRAAAAGIAELRLTSETEPVGLAQIVPRKSTASGANPIDRPFLYAATIAAACPLLVRPANFLPSERRAGQSRIWLIPTAVLAILLLLCAIAYFSIGPYRERDYLKTLHQEISRVEPAARHAADLDKRTEQARSQIALLDQFRGRSQADFEMLNELTRILPPPTWASLVEIYPDYLIIAGQTEQAAPLLKIIDSSSLFHNSEFTNSVSRSGKDEIFRIKTYRRRK